MSDSNLAVVTNNCNNLGSTFINNQDIIKENDTVIVYLNHLTHYVIVVKRGCTLNMRYGALRHEFLIGKRYGTQISATAGYVFILRANPNLWTRTLHRQTQILYTSDIGTILLLLDVRPGSIICETGTGSGSLSHAIATTLAPNGHLYSHDIDEGRVKIVRDDLKQHGLNCCTIVQRDVCVDGFVVKDECDGVFLDLPAPWEAINHAKAAIKSSKCGRLVNFSPCIEQVYKVCVELKKHGFIQIETIEIVPRKLKVTTFPKKTLSQINFCNENIKDENDEVVNRKKKQNFEKPMNNEDCTTELAPFPYVQPTHTGYLVSATLLPHNTIN